LKEQKVNLNSHKYNIFNYLYKTIVFLILILILSEYIKSNELRASILVESKKINSSLLQLQQSTKILKQQKNLDESVLAFGATIMFDERSDSSGLYNGDGESKGGY
jgi:hypothetical protein